MAGVVLQCRDEGWTKRVLLRRPSHGGGFSVGRPRKRWEDELCEFAGRGWMSLAKDKSLWHALRRLRNLLRDAYSSAQGPSRTSTCKFHFHLHQESRKTEDEECRERAANRLKIHSQHPKMSPKGQRKHQKSEVGAVPKAFGEAQEALGRFFDANFDPKSPKRPKCTPKMAPEIDQNEQKMKTKYRS